MSRPIPHSQIQKQPVRAVMYVRDAACWPGPTPQESAHRYGNPAYWGVQLHRCSPRRDPASAAKQGRSQHTCSIQRFMSHAL